MKEKKKWKLWLSESTKIVGFNPASFEEKWSVNFSRVQFISFVTAAVIFIAALVYLLLSYTFFTTLLPNSVRDKSRNEVLKVHRKMEELVQKVDMQERYIGNLQNVILGNYSIDSVFNDEEIKPNQVIIDSTKSKAEELLEASVLSRKQEQIQPDNNLPSELFLLEPLVGVVSQKFDYENQHFGVDIVTKENEPVLASLNGVVVYSSYIEADGWVLVINHPNDIVTIYKHCNKLLRSLGDKVSSGDPVALVGNTGTNSTGVHLHFELWSANKPVDPLKYLSFK